MSTASGDLQQRLVQVTERALETGALHPIQTRYEVVPDGGIPFGVRIVDNLRRKDAAQLAHSDRDRRPRQNPFLPYEEALWVTHISDTHTCLLNKYNVVDHHLLVITREYESQDSWLTTEDFRAIAYCLARIDGLAFYNAGRRAGASQHHKHLQLVPFNHGQPGLDTVPISKVIAPEKARLAHQDCLPLLPFRHSIQLLPQCWTHPLDDITETLSALYRQIMTNIGLDLSQAAPTIPYNLLLTRDWMMGIPRTQGSYQDIGVNSLGYAGWLLVKTMAEMEHLKQIGPLSLLSRVGRPRPDAERDREAVI